MNNKKEMTKVQQYAVKAAREKAIAINKEMQSLLLAIAKELEIDAINETWGLSDDMKCLERQNIPKDGAKK